MATVFDPYLQWLGIRDPQRPPNHYRLLGLELFENDASVIAMSADRQMAHLRNFKTGPEADVAERLLNELSTARICLLKADRKAGYDQQLRASLQPKPLPTAKPMVTAAPAPTSAASRAAPAYSKPAAKAAWKPWAALAGLVSLTVGLTVLLIQKNLPPSDEQVAVKEEGEGKKVPPKNNPKPQPAVKPAPVLPTTSKSLANPEPKSNESTNVKTDASKQPPASEPENATPLKPLPKNTSDNDSNKPNKQQLTSTNKNVEPMTDPRLLLGEAGENTPPEKSSVDEEPKEEPTIKPETLVVAQAPPAEPAKPSRLAVPDKAAIAAKTKEIRDIFDEEYKSQKPEVKAALSTKLRQSSIDSKEDTVMRYVLLNEARANAILGGSVKVAVEVTEELVRDYDVSDGEERFTLFSKLLAGANRNAAYSQLVLEELRKSIAMLQETDEYDVALKLVNIALAAARNMRDPSLVTELAQRAKELNLQKQSFQKAKIAKENLAKSPADPAANEQWGSYLSFTKGEFNAGLPFLARGSSADLAELARRELANNQAPSDQLKLADDWWAYGEKLQAQDTARSVNIWQHAGQKYVSLFPKLTGIDKAKAEKRINELKKINEQKNLRDQEQIVKLLTRKTWMLQWDNPSPPEKMIFRPDGSLDHLFFQLWGFDGNELVLKGLQQGDKFHHIGKVNFSFVKFDVEFYQGGRLVNRGTARPVD